VGLAPERAKTIGADRGTTVDTRTTRYATRRLGSHLRDALRRERADVQPLFSQDRTFAEPGEPREFAVRIDRFCPRGERHLRFVQVYSIVMQTRIADNLDARRRNALGCMTPVAALVAVLVLTG
jgi:hypothetical protein